MTFKKINSTQLIEIQFYHKSADTLQLEFDSRV